MVGILESNAKLNSKLRLKLKLKIELSLAINTQNVLNTMEWPKTDYFCLNVFKTIENVYTGPNQCNMVQMVQYGLKIFQDYSKWLKVLV